MIGSGGRPSARQEHGGQVRTLLRYLGGVALVGLLVVAGTWVRVAQIAGRGLRGIDVFGRFGGEEFLLLLPDTDRSGASVVAERIRAAVAAETPVTVTVGVAQHARDEAAAAVLARADEALYRGKAGGRNKVVVQG